MVTAATRQPTLLSSCHEPLMNASAPIAFHARPTPHPESATWTVDEIEALYSLPFLDLVFRAAALHREHFDPQRIQLSTLVSIKTGGCPEDCGYCPQSAHHDTPVENQPMMTVNEVLSAARAAKDFALAEQIAGQATRTAIPGAQIRAA